jgi:hypothetical protein
MKTYKDIIKDKKTTLRKQLSDDIKFINENKKLIKLAHQLLNDWNDFSESESSDMYIWENSSIIAIRLQLNREQSFAKDFSLWLESKLPLIKNIYGTDEYTQDIRNSPITIEFVTMYKPIRHFIIYVSYEGSKCTRVKVGETTTTIPVYEVRCAE